MPQLGPGAAGQQWPRTHGHQGREPREQGQGRCGQHHRPPGQWARRGHEVGQRRAEGQAADEQPEGAAAVDRSRPRRGQLHPHRVDPGQEGAGQEAQGYGGAQPVGHQGERRRAPRRTQRARGRESVRRHPVGEREQPGEHRAGGEAELDRGGEPHRGAGREPPLDPQRRRDRGGGEPHRQAEHLHAGDERQLPPGPLGLLDRPGPTLLRAVHRPQCASVRRRGAEPAYQYAGSARGEGQTAMARLTQVWVTTMPTLS